MKDLIEQIQKNRIGREIERLILSLDKLYVYDGTAYFSAPQYNNNHILVYRNSTRQMHVNTIIRFILKDLYGENPLEFDEILLDYIQNKFKPKRIIYERF